MKELDDVEAASIINNGFMMAHTNRFDTVRFMTNLKIIYFTITILKELCITVFKCLYVHQYSNCIMIK